MHAAGDIRGADFRLKPPQATGDVEEEFFRLTGIRPDPVVLPKRDKPAVQEPKVIPSFKERVVKDLLDRSPPECQFGGIGAEGEGAEACEPPSGRAKKKAKPTKAKRAGKVKTTPPKSTKDAAEALTWLTVSEAAVSTTMVQRPSGQR
eukprot:g26012.t1